MTFNLFASLTLNGLAMGMIYAMISVGLILLIRSVGVLNFAQGELLMLGTFVCQSMVVDLSLPVYIMAPLSVIFSAVLGLFFMTCTYWPLRNASYPTAPIIATMGASLILLDGTKLIFGNLPRRMPSLMTDENGRAVTVNFFGTKFQMQYVLAILAACAALFLIHILFEKLYAGRMMEAASQDKTAAELIGISTFLTTSATYALVCILLTTAGFLVAPVYFVTTSLTTLNLRAFAGTVIGGWGSIKGAIVGCIIVGLVEAFSTIAFSTYKDVVVFSVLIVFLIFRPYGLFKSKISDKA